MVLSASLGNSMKTIVSALIALSVLVSVAGPAKVLMPRSSGTAPHQRQR
jgi:hypothetical protein